MSRLSRARAVVAAISDEEVAQVIESEARLREQRRHEREERAARPYRPPFRCTECHAYTSSATADCRRCGHRGATADEGHRTHARPRRRRT